MKICLIQPPIKDYYTTSIRNIPLGLISVGSNISSHDVQIVDLRLGKSRKVNPPDVFENLSEYYRETDNSPFGLYKKYYRFGKFASDYDEWIPNDADVYGISALFTTYSETVVELINFLKTRQPECKVVIGGPACAAMPGFFLKQDADFEVFCEGELAFQQLLDGISQNRTDFSEIPNLTWTKDSQVIQNKQEFIKDLDGLNFCDYNLPGLPEYSISRKKHAMLMISRGCPNACSFCSIQQVMGFRYRTRSVANVICEMEEKLAQGFRSFDFEDDHFGGDKKWLHSFLDEVIRRFSQYDLSLQAMNGITASNLDFDLLMKMKKAGFSSLNLALVSENEQRQIQLNRPFDTEQFTKLVEIANQLNFFITGYIIIGLPGYTISDMLDSVAFLASQPCLIGPSFFYLVPGTKIFQQCEKEKILPEDIRCYRSSFMPYETDEFSRTDLMTLFRICRMVNFMKEIEGLEIEFSGQITDDKIHLSDKLKPNEIRLQLGLALLEHSQKNNSIFGTRKISRSVYQLVEEKINPEIVMGFFNRSLKIVRIK